MIRRHAGVNLKGVLLTVALLAGSSAVADPECDYSSDAPERILNTLIVDLTEPTSRPADNHVVWRTANDRYEYATVGGCVDMAVEVGVVYGFARVSDIDSVKEAAIDLTHSLMTDADHDRLVEALHEGDYTTFGSDDIDGMLFLGIFIAHPDGEIVVSRETGNHEERISVSWPII